jgi:hypothetical protein
MRNRACAKFQHRADGTGEGIGAGVQAVLKAGLANDAAMGETQRTLTLEE